MDYKFIEFCRDNSYTGDIMVTSYGVDIRVRKGNYTAGYSIDEERLKEARNKSVIFDEAFEVLKRMIDNAEIQN